MVDLDGTLARTAEANLLAYTAALSEVGVTISPERFAASVQGRNWREFLPSMLSDAGVQADPAAVARRKTELYRTMLPAIAINLPLVALIETCRDRLQMRTALVTSASRASVTELLKVHDLTRLFDTVVTGDDVKHHKPDPEAYALAATQLGVSPEESLVYEDAEVGVASATQFGAHVIRIIF
jgi:HAD superfamily hydrolase (TIGR01509 family)